MTINRANVLKLWQGAKVTPAQQAMFNNQANLAMAYKQNFYDPVVAKLGVPWYLVAMFDMREESFNHNGYLGNGDPLHHKTVHVPAGRGPFANWYDGAIDALQYDKVTPAFGQGDHWDIVTVLIAGEKYNGIGYEGWINDPYIWAGTNQQQRGKFDADGHRNSTVWDTQPGCAGLLLTLKLNHGIDLNEA